MRPTSQAAWGLCLELEGLQGPGDACTGGPGQSPGSGECLSEHGAVHVRLLES